ncbi:DUF438 domain-containing protein [Lactobacillus colini]|uniref:DUF438 domain-containing protein n=1 Tax=Lactobacillus colini TaxID=1819254 RepID=A0ABS4MCU6_9LACO|nr:DUF438 domain-containing protein [Lactobacillus colini]MBP2057433.1 DUF438 domain-containing protein [Lactobacillus colini]
MTNIKKERQNEILKILHYIQNGGDFATAKKMFKDEFDQVDVSEITDAERELISQGLDPREIQYLCNVHADVFKGSIKDNGDNPDFSIPGHPVHTIKLENLVISSLINDALLSDLKKWTAGDDQALAKIRQELHDLATIDKHYRRKETSIFPIMTKYGITAPPKVMWGVDDKIRKLIKAGIDLADEDYPQHQELSSLIEEVSHEVLEMVFKEEKIMIPMIDEVASVEDWYNVKQEEADIGYTLIQKPMNWKPKLADQTPQPPAAASLNQLSSLVLNFKEGSLNLEQLNAILDLLPFAITFVDSEDKVAYFGGAAKIFPHSKNVIGNSVYSCHLPESVPVVKRILDDFRNNKKSSYEFWFTPKMLGQTLYLQYMAVHNQAGEYLGCLEVAQNITKIKNLKGEKKKLD